MVQPTERTGAPVDVAAPGGSGLLTGLVRSCRPKQWLKNVLVVTAPGMAGVLTQPRALLEVTIAFVAFCLASSGTYLVNDARDVDADRVHTRKRHRPVAAGVVPVAYAYALGIVFLVGSFALTAVAGSLYLALTLVAYLTLTTAYTLWLRDVAILDIMAVAGGFVLRMVGGAVAVPVAISHWFLIVGSLGSLFVVAGKREAELRANAPGTRRTLTLYSREFLGYVRSATTGAVLIAYCLWVVDYPDTASRLAFGLSAIPLTVGLLRYGLLVDRGFGEAPEDVLLHDRLMVVAGACLALGLGIGVYLV